MARYVVHVRSPRSPGDAFAYMADLSNFSRWDPGVERAEQVEGDGPEFNAAFDVTVKAIPRPLTLRYHIIEYEPPTWFVARAESRRLTSLDTITVRGTDSGSVVTYEAELTLNGPTRALDPLVGIAFKRIGDRAAAGLIQALDGEQVDEP